MRLVISAIEGLTQKDFDRVFARPQTAGTSHRQLADRTARELGPRSRITRGLRQRIFDESAFGLTPQQELERDLLDAGPTIAPQSKTEQLQADVAAHQGWELDSPLHPSDTQNVVNGWLSDTSSLLSDLYDSAFQDGQANFAQQYPHLFGGDASTPPDEGDAPDDSDDDDKDAAMRNHFSSIAKMANEIMGIATVGQLLGWFNQNQRRVDLQAAQVAWAGEQHGYREAGVGKGLIIEWELDEGAEHCDDCPSLADGSPYTDEDGDNPLPTFPGSGDTACMGNCRCSLNYVEAAVPEGAPTDDEDLSPEEAEAAVEEELGIDLADFGGAGKGGLGGAAMWLQDALDGLDREVGLALDAKGHVLAAHVGTKDTVIFQRAQLKRMRGAALSVHNHPGGQSFSPSDVAFAHGMRFGEIDVFSNRWTYTLRPQSGKFKPEMGKAVLARAEEVADAVLKDIEAEAHAGFAAQLKGVFKYGQPLSWPDYWKLDTQDFWHQVWTKVAPEFGLDYKRLANPYYVAKPLPAAPKAVLPGIGYAPLTVPTDIIREEVPSAPKALGSLPKDFPKTFGEMANWQTVPGPSGSQQGWWVQGPNGKTYYIKPQVSLDRATNEIGTLLAYESLGAKAGIDIPFAGLVKDAAGKAYVVSQKMDFAVTAHTSSWWASPQAAEARADAKKLWAADSLLSHYDVVGLVNDNMLTTAGGKVVRIEGGAGMKYRAQGAVKPGWSPSAAWDEPWTMRGKAHGLSPASTQTAPVFGAITDSEAADLLMQLDVTGGKLESLKKAWAAIGMSPDQIEYNANVIAARLLQVQHVATVLKGGMPASVMPYPKAPSVIKTITIKPASGNLPFTPWNALDDPLAEEFIQKNPALFDEFWKTKAGYAGGAFHYTVTKATPASAGLSLPQRAKIAFASWANTANDIILTGGADWSLLPPKLADWFKAHESAFKAAPAVAVPKLPAWDKAADPIGAKFALDHHELFDEFTSSKAFYQGGAFNYAITQAVKAEGLEGAVATGAQKAQVAFARWYTSALADDYSAIPGKAAMWFKSKVALGPAEKMYVVKPATITPPISQSVISVGPMMPVLPYAAEKWSPTVLSSFTHNADVYFQELQQSMGGYSSAKDKFIKEIAPQFEQAIANGHMTYDEALETFQTILGGDLGDLEEHINIVFGPTLAPAPDLEPVAPVRVSGAPTWADAQAYVNAHPELIENPSSPFGFYNGLGQGDADLAKAWASTLAGEAKGWTPGFQQFLDYWKTKAAPESGLSLSTLNAHFPASATTIEGWLPTLEKWQEWVGDSPYVLKAVAAHSPDAAAYLKAIGIGVKDQLDAAIAKLKGMPAAAQSAVEVAKTLPAIAPSYVEADIKVSKAASNFYVVPHGGGPAIILGHSAAIDKVGALWRANQIATWQAKAPQLFTGMKRISFTGAKSYFKADQKVLIVSKTVLENAVPDEAKFWHAMGLKLVDENPGWLPNFKAAMSSYVAGWQADDLAQSFSAYMAHPETLHQKVRDFWKAHLGVDTSAPPTFKIPLNVDNAPYVAPTKFAAPTNDAWLKFQADGGNPYVPTGPEFKVAYDEWTKGELDMSNATVAPMKKWFDENMVAPVVTGPTYVTGDSLSYYKALRALGWDHTKAYGETLTAAYAHNDPAYTSSLATKATEDSFKAAVDGPAPYVAPESAIKPITPENWKAAFKSSNPENIKGYVEQWLTNGSDATAITAADVPQNVVAYLKSLNIQTYGDLKVAAAQLGIVDESTLAGLPAGLYADFKQSMPDFNWKPNTLKTAWEDWLADAGKETTGNAQLDSLFQSYLSKVITPEDAAAAGVTLPAPLATGGVIPGSKTEPKGIEALKADALKWSETDDPDGSKFVGAHAGIWSEFKATKMGYKGGGFNWAVQTLTTDLPKGTAPKVRQQVALARLFKMYHEEPEKLKEIVPKVYKWLGNVIEGQAETAEVWSVSGAAAGVTPSAIATAKFEKLPVGWDTKAELQKTNSWMQSSMPSSRVVYDNWKAAAEGKPTLNKWVRDLLGPAMKTEIDATGEQGDVYYKLRGLAFTKSYLMAKAGYFDELAAISPKLRDYWKDMLFPPPPRPIPPGRAPWAKQLQIMNPGGSKRNALVAQLERDLQGHPAELERWRALQNGTQSWKGGSQSSYHAAGEKYVKGLPVNDSIGKGAAAMWDTIRDAAPAAPELGRSISWSGPQASVDYWKGLVGKNVDMQLSGFSDSGVDFAPSRNTRYVLAAGSQAFSTLAFTPGYEGEREWIVGGRFKVTKVEKKGSRTYVYLEWVAPDRTGTSVLHERA